MKPRSFFFRLFAGNLLLVGLVISISFVVAYTYLSREHRRNERENQDQLLTALQHGFQQSWPAPPDQIQRRCLDLGKRLPARITIIARDGAVLGDSTADPKSMVSHHDRPEVIQALATGLGTDIRPSETLGREFRYLARPIRPDPTGPVEGVVRVAMPLQALIKSRDFIRRTLLWSMLAAVVMAALLGLLISWVWSRPLRQISRTARRLAAGDLEARAAIQGPRELAQLAAALNEMRASLGVQINTIARQHENLRTVVTNLREGVIALDERQRIVLMNEAAAALLSLEPGEHTGEPIQSVARDAGIIDLLGSASADEPADAQLQVRSGAARLTLDAHATRVPPIGDDGIRALLVLRDITDIDRMATMKAEFVANASHELRTPLATLRVAVDSLAEAPPTNAEALARFATILDRNVRRLEAMTADLLNLHMVEQTGSNIRPERIALAELAQWAQGQFVEQAEAKGVAFDFNPDPPTGHFSSNRRLAQLILQNLIDNAIKFTTAPGRVFCRITAATDRTVVVVSDDGPGIDPKLQDRIFERFFQVDSSRVERGTGLGLAIVKYAAERLGATIDLSSQLGEGTTVTITIPTPAAE